MLRLAAPPIVLNEPELRALVPLDLDVVDRIEESFRWIAEGSVVQPPILHLELADRGGDVDVKTAYVRGLDRLAVKIATAFPANVEGGLPASLASVLVLSAETGRPLAVLLDNGYLTDARTAAAGAVAARHLAQADCPLVAVVGTGVQAELQVRALALVRKLEQVNIWGRTRARADRLARRLETSLGITSAVANDVSSAVRQANLIITATSSREALISADDLRPGQHVTAMGSDLPGKRELGPGALRRARVVCDNVSQARRLGELQHDPGLDAEELSSIVVGRQPGRLDQAEITVADLTGLGAQDTAIADLALTRHGL